MFIKLGSFGNKQIGIMQKIQLRKLKVFYQILIMVIMMIAFLGIQSYMGLRVTKKMHNNTQTIFSESVGNINEISRLKMELNLISIRYLETLTGKDIYGMGSIRNNRSIKSLIDRVNELPFIDVNFKKLLTNNLNSLLTIINETTSDTNHGKLQEISEEINSIFDSVHSDIIRSSLVNISNIKTYASQSGIITVIIMLISILLSIIIALIISNSISSPLKQMEGAAKLLGAGDLSKNINTIGCPEVIGAINGLNKAIVDLRNLVKGINEQASILYSASNELRTASFETSKSSAEVAKAMEELAKGASEQAGQITQAVSKINMLSETVNEVSEEVEDIALVSEKVAQSAKIGQKSTYDVATKINELFDSTKEVAEVIDTLSKNSVEIGEITSVIHGIAEQTTLLALNASIEAARTGIHGKGFEVIASETGKLAEQSKQAVRLISDLISRMKVHTDHAVEVMKKGIIRAEEGKNLATNAYHTFEAIFKTLMNILSQINAIAASTKKMAHNNEEVNEVISVIAAISEESMAATEQVSAITQEQNASMEELSALAEDLTKIADNLKQYVTLFELGSENEKRENYACA